MDAPRTIRVRRSGPGHVLPGPALVGVRLGREAEDPFADDVALDLRGPALDRVGPGAEELPDEAGRRRVAVDPGLTGGAPELEGELLEGLVRVGLADLGDGPGRAGLAGGGRALDGERQEAALGVGDGDVVTPDGVPGHAGGRRQVEHLVQ